ncbi:MAG TPA: site-specific integrase [Anaerolineales bacterium]
MVHRYNYMLVRRYLQDLGEVYQLSSSSLSRYRFYLRHLLLWAGDTPFQQAAKIRPTFPSYVSNLPGRHGEAQLASVTQKKITEAGKRFFIWVKQNHPKDFSSMSSAWLESLRPPRVRDVSDEHEYVSLEEVLRLIAVPHEEDDLALLRDKAATAMLFLSGARASAFTTLPISAVDLLGRTLHQWPELGVATKNGKRATTFLLPIPELLAAAQTWDDKVRLNLPSTAPWYAPICTHWGSQSLDESDPGKNRHQALDKRLRKLFNIAGLTYKSAHKFRHGHAVYGLLKAQTMADYKAISMNLMHNDIKITDSIYAPILSEEVKERIAGLTASPPSVPETELDGVLDRLSNTDLSKVLRIVASRLSA